MESTRGFITLNILRSCSIISLIMVIVASLAVVVKSFVVTKFYFFDAINQVFLSAFAIFLMASELSLFKAYFNAFWPAFGCKSSLVALGLSELVVGFLVLGNLNEDHASKENLGTAFNSLLLAAGVVASVIGLLNSIASYIYCDSTTSTTARMIRSRQSLKETHNRKGLKELELGRSISPPYTYASSPLYTSPPPSACAATGLHISRPVHLTMPQRAHSQRSYLSSVRALQKEFDCEDGGYAVYRSPSSPSASSAAAAAAGGGTRSGSWYSQPTVGANSGNGFS